MSSMDKIRYKAVFVPVSMRKTSSPCDICQRVECIGVDDCRDLYGDNYTFVVEHYVKRYTTDFSDDDMRENDEYLAFVTSLT